MPVEGGWGAKVGWTIPREYRRWPETRPSGETREWPMDTVCRIAMRSGHASCHAGVLPPVGRAHLSAVFYQRVLRTCSIVVACVTTSRGRLFDAFDQSLLASAHCVTSLTPTPLELSCRGSTSGSLVSASSPRSGEAAITRELLRNSRVARQAAVN